MVFFFYKFVPFCSTLAVRNLILIFAFSIFFLVFVFKAKNWMEAAMQRSTEKNYMKNSYVQLQRSFCSQHTWMIFKEDAKKNVTQRKSTLEVMINICLQLKISSSSYGSGFAWGAKSMKKKRFKLQFSNAILHFERIPACLLACNG